MWIDYPEKPFSLFTAQRRGEMLRLLGGENILLLLSLLKWIVVGWLV